MPRPAFPQLGRSPKLLLPALGIAGLIGLGLFVLVQQQQLGQLRAQLRAKQQQLREMEQERESLTERLEAAQAERKTLEGRIASLRSELSSALTDLDRARLDLQTAQERGERLEEEQLKLSSQITTVTAERDETTQRMARLQQENAELDRALSRLRERMALLDRDYRQLAGTVESATIAPRSGVTVVGSSDAPAPAAGPVRAAGQPSAIGGSIELPPIIVRKDQAGMSLPIRGRVVEVNAPQGFLVVDKGSLDGVHLGMAFDITRGADAVSRATVVRVRPRLAACDIVGVKTVGQVEVGDAAVQSGP